MGFDLSVAVGSPSSEKPVVVSMFFTGEDSHSVDGPTKYIGDISVPVAKQLTMELQNVIMYLENRASDTYVGDSNNAAQEGV